MKTFITPLLEFLLCYLGARSDNRLLHIILLTFSLASIQSLQGAECIWNGGSGKWSVAGNWSCGSVPGSGDNVTISTGTVTMNVAATVNNLTLSSGTISGANSLTVNGIMAWNSGTVSAPLTISGTATLNLASGSSKTLNGTLTLSGTTNHSGGNLNLSNGDVVNNSGTYNITGGRVSMTGTGRFNNTGNFNINYDGTLLSGAGLFDNDGSFTRTGGTGTLIISTDLVNEGTVKQQTTGTISFGSGASFTNNGILSGTGTFSFSTTFTQSGNIIPGLSAGLMTLNKLDNTSGILNIEIDDTGTTPGTDHDKIAVTAAATFGGTLNISLLNGNPASGTNFTILTATGGVGGSTFASVNFPSPAANWSIIYNSNDVVVTYQEALPVELVDFTAVNAADHILLQWQTASENNNRGFTIERSSGNFSWYGIGFEAGHGNSNVTHNYLYVDKTPQPGLNYYRLKQLDTDGNFSYSKIISVNRTRSGEELMKVYPNPAGDMVIIHFDPLSSQSGVLILSNSSGQILDEVSLEISPQTAVYQYRFTDLSPGIYFIY